MKIFILCELRDGAAGGSYQFLKVLETYLVNNELLAKTICEADVVFFNSYLYSNQVMRLKRHYPDKLFVHRVDGPISLYSGLDDGRDQIVYRLNQIAADATIFQSVYSMQTCHERGMRKNQYETVIYNSCNELIFYPETDKKLDNSKTRIIATSYSDNWNKGFDIYKWLDDNLDFTKYEMVFVGNTPVSFNNITHIEPLSQTDLADELRKSDIYITAAINESCSNSLIEAMACGLYVIAINSGSNRELVKYNGVLYDNREQIIDHIENYSLGEKHIYDIKGEFSASVVGLQYVKFVEKLIEDNIQRKKIRLYHLIYYYWCVWIKKVRIKIKKYG